MDDFEALLNIIIISSLLIAIIGIYELLIGKTFYYSLWTNESRYRNGILRVGSTVADPNFICFYLVPIIPILFYKIKSSGSKFLKWIVLLFFILVFYTSSRVGLISSYLAIYMIFKDKINKYFGKNKIIKTFIILFFTIIILYIGILYLPNLSLNMNEGSFAIRAWVAIQALKLGISKIFPGIGWRRFQEYLRPYLRHEFPHIKISFDTMNTYLQVIVAMGIIGFIIMVLVIINCYIKSRRYKVEFLKYYQISLTLWLIIGFTLDGFFNIYLWILFILPSIVVNLENKNKYILK